MNKRVISSIIKKYNDEETRDEAVSLAQDHGYSLRVQIENGHHTLMGVSSVDVSTWDENETTDDPTEAATPQAVQEEPAKTPTKRSEK